jgi:hypothetical protein
LEPNQEMKNLPLSPESPYAPITTTDILRIQII